MNLSSSSPHGGAGLNSSSIGGAYIRDKLSQQLENIVRKTKKNLDEGVFRAPSNIGVAAQTPNYRTGSHSRFSNKQVDPFSQVGSEQNLSSHRSALGLSGTRLAVGRNFDMAGPLDNQMFHADSNSSQIFAKRPGSTFISGGGLHQQSQTSFSIQQQLPAEENEVLFQQKSSLRPRTQSNLAQNSSDRKRNQFGHSHNQSMTNVHGGALPPSGILNSQSHTQLKRVQLQNMVDESIQNYATPKSNFQHEDLTTSNQVKEGAVNNQHQTVSDFRRSLEGQIENLPADIMANEGFGSGSGAGRVNEVLNEKYGVDYQLKRDLYSKLEQETATNAMNLEQRQRIFEDVIIQRVKIIQNYVKKSVQKLKVEMSQTGNGSVAMSNPVILNSIHNDGMALDLKIKDIVKWKIEPFEQKVKAKEDKIMKLEVVQNRLERQIHEMAAALDDSSIQIVNSHKEQIQRLENRFDQNDANLATLSSTLQQSLTHSVTGQVTDSLMQTIMPQIDIQIQKHIEAVKDAQDKDRSSQADALKAETDKLMKTHLGEERISLEAKIKDIQELMTSKLEDNEKYRASEHRKLEERITEIKIEAQQLAESLDSKLESSSFDRRFNENKIRLGLIEAQELEERIETAMGQAVKDSISEFEDHNRKNVNTIREEICALENKVDLRIEEEDQLRADGKKQIDELEARLENLSFSASEKPKEVAVPAGLGRADQESIQKASSVAVTAEGEAKKAQERAGEASKQVGELSSLVKELQASMATLQGEVEEVKQRPVPSPRVIYKEAKLQPADLVQEEEQEVFVSKGAHPKQTKQAVSSSLPRKSTRAEEPKKIVETQEVISSKPDVAKVQHQEVVKPPEMEAQPVETKKSSKPIEQVPAQPVEAKVESPIKKQLEKPVEKPQDKPIEKPVEQPKPAEKPQSFWDQPASSKPKEEVKKPAPVSQPQQSAILRTEEDDDIEELEDMFVSKPVAKPRAAPVSSKAPPVQKDIFHEPEPIQQSIPSLPSAKEEAHPVVATEEDIEDSDEAPPASFSPFEPKKTIQAEKKAEPQRQDRYMVPAEDDEEIDEIADDYDVVLDLEPQSEEKKPTSIMPPQTSKSEEVQPPAKEVEIKPSQEIPSAREEESPVVMPRRGIPDASNPGDIPIIGPARSALPEPSPVAKPVALAKQKPTEEKTSFKEDPLAGLADLDEIKPVEVKEEPKKAQEPKPKASPLEDFDDDDDDWGNSEPEKSSPKKSAPAQTYSEIDNWDEMDQPDLSPQKEEHAPAQKKVQPSEESWGQSHDLDKEDDREQEEARRDARVTGFQEDESDQFEDDPVIVKKKTEPVDPLRAGVTAIPPKEPVREPARDKAIPEQVPQNEVEHKPRLTPVINERLWNQPPPRNTRASQALCDRIESAIDNKLNNWIEDLVAAHLNHERKQYKDINEINQNIMSSSKPPAGSSRPMHDDMVIGGFNRARHAQEESQQPIKSQRQGMMGSGRETISFGEPMGTGQRSKNTGNVLDGMDELEDLL